MQKRMLVHIVFVCLFQQAFAVPFAQLEVTSEETNPKSQSGQKEHADPGKGMMRKKIRESIVVRDVAADGSSPTSILKHVKKDAEEPYHWSQEEEEDRDKAKFGFELKQKVAWISDDEDVPKGSVGTVVGFTEDRVRVKFKNGTWKFLPSELMKVEPDGVPAPSPSPTTTLDECPANKEAFLVWSHQPSTIKVIHNVWAQKKTVWCFQGAIKDYAYVESKVVSSEACSKNPTEMPGFLDLFQKYPCDPEGNTGRNKRCIAKLKELALEIINTCLPAAEFPLVNKVFTCSVKHADDHCQEHVADATQ